MATIGPGTILYERFEVVRALGRGAMASVWLAVDRSGDRVALKVLHPELRRRKNMVQRLEKEAALLRTLAHPGIAAALGFYEDDAFVSLVMEYVDGLTLERWLGEQNLAGRSLSIEELVEMFDALLDPIEHAHSRGILHRDLKPQNIMLAAGGSGLKVLDFGIAKLLEGDLHDATTQGRRVGSPYYMSPEQTVGDPVDARSDIFSLGSILFEMITLRRAWLLNIHGARLAAFVDDVPDAKANGVLEISARIAGAERPRVSEYRTDLGEAARGIDALVFRALAIDPRARISSIGELRSELQALLGDKTAALEKTVALEKTLELERTPLLTQPLLTQPLLTRPTLLSPAPAKRRAFGLIAAAGIAALSAGIWAFARVAGEEVVATQRAVTAPAEVEVRARSVPKVEARASEEAPVEVPVAAIPEEGRVRVENVRRSGVRPADVFAALDSLLAEARGEPADPARKNKLAAEIARVADSVGDPARRRRILRVTETSAITGDLEGLESALEELKRALRPPE